MLILAERLGHWRIYFGILDLGGFLVCTSVIIGWRKHGSDQQRPYQHDSTASRLLSEVKHARAGLVLRWGTTLESPVLLFCSLASIPLATTNIHFAPLPTHARSI